MEERGVKVDHSTLNRWVINYSSSLALAAKKNKRAVATSWRMDETYIKGGTCKKHIGDSMGLAWA